MTGVGGRDTNQTGHGTSKDAPSCNGAPMTVAEQATLDCAARLRKILESHDGAITFDLIRSIAALATSCGIETTEHVLDVAPDLMVHSPMIKAVHHQSIIANQATIARGLLAQAPEQGISVRRDGTDNTRAVYDRTREVFERIDFGKCRRFVMIGCGQVPTTLLHVHDRTEVPELVGLDIRPEATETVRALAARFALPRIAAECTDGKDYDFSAADVVYVANMVEPKQDVLAQIVDTTRPHVDIVVREPFGIARLWSDCAEDTLDPRLAVTGRGFVDDQTLTRDVFLRRRDRI